MNQDHEEEVKGMIENPLMKQMFIIISQIIVGSKSNLLARAWKHLNPVKILGDLLSSDWDLVNWEDMQH